MKKIQSKFQGVGATFLALTLSAPVSVAGVFALPGLSSANGASECDGNPDNLVLNCGFEDVVGYFPNWTVTGEYWYQSSPHQGFTHSGVYAAGLAAPEDRFTTLSQTIPTSAGKTYALGFWLRTASPAGTLEVYWDGTLTARFGPNPGPFYSFHEFQQLPAMADIARLDFRYQTCDFPSGCYFSLDDVTVVPEL